MLLVRKYGCWATSFDFYGNTWGKLGYFLTTPKVMHL
jgi:hypothetical protein